MVHAIMSEIVHVYSTGSELTTTILIYAISKILERKTNQVTSVVTLAQMLSMFGPRIAKEPQHMCDRIYFAINRVLLPC